MAKRINNKALRMEMAKTGVTFKEIADVVGVHQITVMNWTKKELPQDKLDSLIAVVRAISEDKTVAKPVLQKLSQKKTNNRIVREAMAEYNICQWQLADMLGIREETLSRMMRYELDIEEQEEIVRLIKEKHNNE